MGFKFIMWGKSPSFGFCCYCLVSFIFWLFFEKQYTFITQNVLAFILDWNLQLISKSLYFLKKHKNHIFNYTKLNKTKSTFLNMRSGKARQRSLHRLLELTWNYKFYSCMTCLLIYSMYYLRHKGQVLHILSGLPSLTKWWWPESDTVITRNLGSQSDTDTEFSCAN